MKTLEEPPPHARFILASTELHKIPATIVSRCQRFAFRALPAGEIAGHLAKVAAAEGIRATPEALGLLARAAEGSLRDGLSLLDQAATLSGGAVSEAECAEILALLPREQLEGLYSAVASGDRSAALATLARLEEGGHDPRQILKELLSLLRELLVLSAGGAGEAADAGRGRLLPLSRAMPYENLLRALSLAIESDVLSRRAEDAALVLQMLVLRLCELPRLRSIEETLAGAAADARPVAPRPGAESVPPAAGPRILGLVKVEPEPEPDREEPPGSRGESEGLARFQEILDSRRRLTAAQASLAESAAILGNELILRFGIDKAAAKEALEEPAAKKLLSDAAREAFGRPLRIVLKTGPPSDGDLGQAAREVPRATLARERAVRSAEADPVVRSALELFRGELTEVKEES